MTNWLFSDFLWLSRRQQRLPSGNKSQQHADHQQGGTKHNRDHQKLYQGGQAPHSSGRTGHHGYSQNRRWHHNQKHSPNDKETHRNAKETENLKIEDSSACTAHVPAEAPRGPEAVEKQSQQGTPEPETKRKDSVHERAGDRPKINLLQSSKDRLRRRLKEKVLFLEFPFLCESGHWPFSIQRDLSINAPDLPYQGQHFSWGVLCFLRRPFIEISEGLSSTSWLRLLPAWVLQGLGTLPFSVGEGWCTHELPPGLKSSVTLQKKSKKAVCLCNYRAKSQTLTLECWTIGLHCFKADIRLSLQWIEMPLSPLFLPTTQQ